MRIASTVPLVMNDGRLGASAVGLVVACSHAGSNAHAASAIEYRSVAFISYLFSESSCVDTTIGA